MALPHPSMNFVPLDTLTASELNQIVANILALSNGTGLNDQSINASKLKDNSITGEKIVDSSIELNKLESNNVIIDLNINRQSFFSGTFSATFNIPKTGKYLIKNPFSVACHKIANTSQQLYVKIDNNNVLNYMYFATSKDNEWGDTRRVLQGGEVLVELTEGQHTITTSGRIDFDQYANFNNTPVQLFALRII